MFPGRACLSSAPSDNCTRHRATRIQRIRSQLPFQGKRTRRQRGKEREREKGKKKGTDRSFYDNFARRLSKHQNWPSCRIFLWLSSIKRIALNLAPIEKRADSVAVQKRLVYRPAWIINLFRAALRGTAQCRSNDSNSTHDSYLGPLAQVERERYCTGPEIAGPVSRSALLGRNNNVFNGSGTARV